MPKSPKRIDHRKRGKETSINRSQLVVVGVQKRKALKIIKSFAQEPDGTFIGLCNNILQARVSAVWCASTRIIIKNEFNCVVQNGRKVAMKIYNVLSEEEKGSSSSGTGSGSHQGHVLNGLNY